MANKHRKKGQWQEIARGRANAGHVAVIRGVSVPDFREVGSAAYRRMAKKR